MNLTTVKATKVKNGIRKIKTIFSMTKLSVQLSPYGYDSVPLEGVNGITIKVGKYSFVLGYAQEAFEGLKSGESAVYSKDSKGKVSSFIINRNDETIEMLGDEDNLVRFSNLKNEFNQLKQDFNTHIANYNASMSAYGGHTHLYSPGPLPPVTTPPPTTPGTPSTPSIANIDNAKHEGIKTNKKGIL